MEYATQKSLDELSKIILGCAIDVHKELGPGLLEKTYEKALLILLHEKELKFRNQVEVPVVFRGIEIDNALKLDILVEDLIIVELKAVDKILPVHEAQILTYLKLLKKPKGILINFYCTNIFYNGQKTFVTETYAQLPKE
ncbi:MAG: GxxExxY protein [Prevotellaceae bacterium]|jgi:GxxExxY protein|nr:GxxExxY protein [Prevotellaceae bacterium]